MDAEASAWLIARENKEIAYDSPWIKKVEINAPAPGTPQDSLYRHPTVPCQQTGYRFAVDTDNYPLPLTVYRPFIQPIAPVHVVCGESCPPTAFLPSMWTD